MTFSRALVLVGSIAALSVILSGCSFGTMGGAPFLVPTDAPVYGDLVVLDTQSSARGDYQHMTISPDADAMLYSPELVLAAATDTGFTEEQILEAQQTAARLIVEFGVDSTAADDTSTFAEWTATAKGDVLASQTTDLFDAESNLVFRQDQNGSPDFIHDGSPRMDDSTAVTLTEVTGGSDPSEGNYLSFSFQTETNYRATDAAVIAAVTSTSPDATPAEILDALAPDVADGEGENLWKTTGTVQYTMLFDDAQERWLIGGYTANYSGGYNLQR